MRTQRRLELLGNDEFLVRGLSSQRPANVLLEALPTRIQDRLG